MSIRCATDIDDRWLSLRCNPWLKSMQMRSTPAGEVRAIMIIGSILKFRSTSGSIIAVAPTKTYDAALPRIGIADLLWQMNRQKKGSNGLCVHDVSGSGTPIREGVKAVRLGLNDTLVASRAHYSAMEESIQDKVATSKAHTEAMFSNLGSELTFCFDMQMSMFIAIGLST